MIIELNGRWTLRQNDSDEPIAAQVPGCVHTDLLAAGKIPDPFVGDNEEALRWIFQDRWTYQREFDLPAEFLQQARIFLCCEGLDTIAHLTLNGKLLGTTDNMFRHWEFDVKSFLVPGMNQIEIRFDSPSAYIENRQKIRPMIYPTAQHQVAAFSQIRKAAFSFGWDWGPCLRHLAADLFAGDQRGAFAGCFHAARSYKPAAGQSLCGRPGRIRSRHRDECPGHPELRGGSHCPGDLSNCGILP